jgi:hypothetical protein
MSRTRISGLETRFRGSASVKKPYGFGTLIGKKARIPSGDGAGSDRTVTGGRVIILPEQVWFLTPGPGPRLLLLLTFITPRQCRDVGSKPIGQTIILIFQCKQTCLTISLSLAFSFLRSFRMQVLVRPRASERQIIRDLFISKPFKHCPSDNGFPPLHRF